MICNNTIGLYKSLGRQATQVNIREVQLGPAVDNKAGCAFQRAVFLSTPKYKLGAWIDLILNVNLPQDSKI